MAKNPEHVKVHLGEDCENVEAYMAGTKLWLGIETTEIIGKSESGKSDMIASTHGNIPIVQISPKVKLSVNMFKQLKSGRRG